MTGAMSRFHLPQAQLAAEKRILGDFEPGSVIGTQFMREARVGQQLARLAIVVLVNQDTGAAARRASPR